MNAGIAAFVSYSQKAISYDHNREKQPEKELKRSAGSIGLVLTLKGGRPRNDWR